MKNNFLLVGIIFGLIFLSSINVMADMPPTHSWLNEQILSTYQGTSTKFYEACVLHPDLCYTGNMLTDISVAYYYVNKGNKYEITHSPGFCVNMLKNAVGSEGVTQDEEFSCAVGVCLHQSEDLISHTIMVPYAIKHTGLLNQVIHVFAEQHLDNLVLKQHPEVTSNILTLNEDSWNKCIPLFKRTLNGYNEYQQDIREGKTDDLINTFISEVKKSVDPNSKTSYDIAFENKVTIFGKIGLIPTGFLLFYVGFMALFGLLAVLLIFRKNKGIINWLSLVLFFGLFAIMLILFISLLLGHAFQTLVWFIKPFSNLVPIGSSENMLNMGIESGQSLLREGESYLASTDAPKIASGFAELNKANESVQYIDYILIGLLFAILIFLIYINFKRKPQSREINLGYGM